MTVLAIVNVAAVTACSGRGLRIVSRAGWSAHEPPAARAASLTTRPPGYVIIGHTATQSCYSHAQCVLTARLAQSYHRDTRGWDDVPYNFLVGGNGMVYEGRGWDAAGAHTRGYNAKSIGIAFIGSFNAEEPTGGQLYAAKKLIERGVEDGKISKDYKLLGHRQLLGPGSPGEKLYRIIETWDHWAPTPEER